MPTYSSDKQTTTKSALGIDNLPVQIEVGVAGTSPLSVGSFRFNCPKCGSAYIATFTALEPRSKQYNNFACTAGDCGYRGPVSR